MTDDEIRQALEIRDLREAYLVELATMLGFTLSEGWSEAAFVAIENASLHDRRTAAVRVIEIDCRSKGES